MAAADWPADSRTGGQLTDPEPVIGLYRAFANLGRLEGHVIDCSTQEPEQTLPSLSPRSTRRGSLCGSALLVGAVDPGARDRQ